MSLSTTLATTAPTTSSLWKKPLSIDLLKSIHQGTAVGHLGIEFTGFTSDSISARMPVDKRTIQPYGILHGGASVVLAETLGSCAAHYASDSAYMAVGLDINANHIRSVREGWVHGTARPVHVGRTTQVWEIRIVDEVDKLVCIARITMAILNNVPK